MILNAFLFNLLQLIQILLALRFKCKYLINEKREKNFHALNSIDVTYVQVSFIHLPDRYTFCSLSKAFVVCFSFPVVLCSFP